MEVNNNMVKDKKKAFIIGAGNLGTALAKYDNFRNCGLNIVALFDNDKKKIGKPVNGVLVLDIARLPNLARKFNVDLAILTLPEQYAQFITNEIVRAGIKHIWNFTAAELIVPDDVNVKNESLAAKFLSFAQEL